MKNLKKLTILHSNDLHGDFLADTVDDKLIGGASMLSGYVNMVREQEQNVLYAIAGDMFRGSVIDAEYKGLSTIEIMNMISPDIVSIGNHEVDYGVAHLLFIEKCARFPIINANLFIKTNHARLFSPYKIIEIDGMRILFIGIITEEILAAAKNDSLVGSFIDTAEAASEVTRICNAHNSIDIDFTVLLTHIGIEADRELAKLLDPSLGVDVIIGGHSHTVIEQPEAVNNILIVQAGTGTDIIGRFDIVVDTDKNCVDSYQWQSVPIKSDHCPRDLQLEELISGFKSQTDAKYSRVVTRFARTLTHPVRNRETELGNLFADVLAGSLGVDVMLLGSGSIRGEALGPIVDYGALCAIFPYDDAILMCSVTADQLKRMLKFMLRDEAFGGHTEFYQLSGAVKTTYSRTNREFTEFTVFGEDVELIAPERLYTIALQSYHFKNFTDFFGVPFAEVEKNAKPRVISTSAVDVLEECLSEHNLWDAHIEGRIKILE